MVVETGNIKVRLAQTQFARNRKSALLLQIKGYFDASRAGVAVSECHTIYFTLFRVRCFVLAQFEDRCIFLNGQDEDTLCVNNLFYKVQETHILACRSRPVRKSAQGVLI